MNGLVVLRTKLMVKAKAADEWLEGMKIERTMNAEDGALSGFEVSGFEVSSGVTTRVSFSVPESVAGMSLSALLYYALFGEGQVKDGLT